MPPSPLDRFWCLYVDPALPDDADDLLAEPLRMSTKLAIDDHHAEHVTIYLTAMERPGVGFDSLTLTIDIQLSPARKDHLTSLLHRLASYFAFAGWRLGKVNLPPISISITDPSRIPTRHSPYRESPRTYKLISKSLRTLRDLDIVKKWYGPIASPVVMVLQNGKYRFCVDFQNVNSATLIDRYPISRPDSVFSALSDVQFFFTMDANKGYHQFELSIESRWLSAFATQKEPQWQYKRVPFSLQNAPAFFQRLIDSLLSHWRGQFVMAYIDHVVIWSST